MENALPYYMRALDLDPVPPPRVQATRLMLATALKIEGYLDQDPTEFHPALENSMMMPEANLVIVGTGCSRPLVTREAMAIAEAVECDLIIVRASETPGRASYDVKLRGTHRPYIAHKLWIPRPTGTGWLIPSVGEGDGIRLGQDGLTAQFDPPYEDWVDRHRGLEHGAEFLSIAVQGWF